MWHTENIKRVVQVTTETDDSGAFVLCLHMITTGNVRKIVRLPHMAADALRAGLVGEFESMDPEERKASWNTSLRASRKAA